MHIYQHIYQNSIQRHYWWLAILLIGVFLGSTLVVNAADQKRKAEKKAFRQYQSLIKSSKLEERLRAIDLLAGIDNAKAAKILLKVIKDGNLFDVAVKASEVLGKYESPAATTVVVKAAKRLKGREERKFLVLESLGRIHNPAIMPQLLKLLKNKDRRYRILGMEGIANLRLPDENIVKMLVPATRQEKDFGLRISALNAIAQTPHPASIPPLLAASKVPGRVKETALRGLMLLTGQSLGDNPKAWATWWKKNNKNFKVDVRKVRERGLAAVPLVVPIDDYHFYGIRIIAKRVLFVIDKSGSMGLGDYPRRIDGVKAEMLRLLDEIDEDVMFNIVFFSHQITFWRGMTLHPANPKNKTNARAYIKNMQPGGATYTDVVMEKSFRFIVGKQGVETVCLLTDGAPFHRDYLDMDMVADKIRKANRFHKARINTIGCFSGSTEQNKGMLGEPPRPQLVDFLQKIAKENDGVFKEIQGMVKLRTWSKISVNFMHRYFDANLGEKRANTGSI